jgi:hypothetical protein
VTAKNTLNELRIAELRVIGLLSNQGLDERVVSILQRQLCIVRNFSDVLALVSSMSESQPAVALLQRIDELLNHIELNTKPAVRN